MRGKINEVDQLDQAFLDAKPVEDELNEVELWKTIKRVWTTLTSKIKNIFAQEAHDKEFGEEYEITIPAQDVKLKDTPLEEDEDIGGIAAVKGNYNEALTIDYINKEDNKPYSGVEISDKHRKYKKDIIVAVKKWKTALVKKVKKPETLKKHLETIEVGSLAMKRYLINQAQGNESTIIGAWLDNLAFHEGAEFKADIRIALRKGTTETIEGYSLKLYGSKSVGLANGSPISLARHIVGDASANAVAKAIDNDDELQKWLETARTANKEYEAAKENGSPEADKLKLKRDRTIARKDINPRLAEILYNELQKGLDTNPIKFAENLQRLMGLSDHETKMLMAVVKDPKKKVEILDTHPELDWTDVTLKYDPGKVNMHVKDKRGVTIVTLATKEGERKAATIKTSFSKVPPAMEWVGEDQIEKLAAGKPKI